MESLTEKEQNKESMFFYLESKQQSHIQWNKLVQVLSIDC